MLMIGEMPVDEHFNNARHNHMDNISIYSDKTPKKI